MDQFIALSFPDQTKIDEAIRALRKFHSEKSDTIGASAVIAKAADGKLSVQEITRTGHGTTVVAALIGALAGLPAGPAAMAVMAAGGAIMGDAADLSNQEDFTKFAHSIAGKVPLGGAVVVADVTADEGATFRAMMESYGGTLIKVGSGA